MEKTGMVITSSIKKTAFTQKFSEDFYKSLFDNSNDGMILADLEAKKFYIANKAICKMLGYSRKEIKKLGVADIYPKEDYPYIVEQFERQSRRKIGEIALVVDIPIKRKNDSIFYADINVRCVKLSGIIYLLCILRDTTDRRRIEKDLENAKIATQNVLEDLQIEKETLIHAKAKDEAMLSSIGEGVIATDQNGKIVLVNHAAEQMLGWSTEQMMGQLLVEVLELSDGKGNLISETKRPITIALKGKTTITTSTDPSYFYIQKKSTRLPVAIIVTPVIVGDSIIGAIDVFRDITKEKEIEKMRMDFLSLASHQLRTPLSGTKWLIETMNRGVLGKTTRKQKEYLSQIYQLNERMIRLVSEMLSVLRLGGGTGSIKKDLVSITDLYKDINASMVAAAKSRKIVLYNTVKNRKIAALETDKEILRNILECFISNAIDYSYDGKRVILSAQEDPVSVKLSVKDSGLGIPKKEQNRIFEQFYRTSNAKDYKPNGTGLGLSNAKTLAKKISAEIWFESQENKGSIFYLRVPKKIITNTKAEKN